MKHTKTHRTTCNQAQLDNVVAKSSSSPKKRMESRVQNALPYFLMEPIQAALRKQYARALNHRFKLKKKNYPCGKMLRQDRDFSTIDAIKRQFEDRWRRGKIVLFIWG
jgi:hypothetical protein